MRSAGPSPFGALLKRFRTAAGLTQQGLAERAGLSVRAISDLERGVNSRPQAHTIHQLAQAFHLSTADGVMLAETGRGTVSVPPTALSRTVPSGGFLGAVPIGPLIGRERELDRVLAAVATVRSGTGQLVLLTGEAGVGKTRLAQEVFLALRTYGFVVATGRCYEAQGALPFHPFVEALEQLYFGAPPHIRAELLNRWPNLGRLLPEWSLQAESDQSEGGHEQQTLFRSVKGFTAALADEKPVALLLDDLHWMDGSSLALLVHLARYTRTHPLLLLGTFRDSDVDGDHPLGAAVRELDREGLLESIALTGFNRQGTAALLSDSLGLELATEEFIDLLHERTDGNPFFVQQVVRALVEQATDDGPDRAWDRKALDELDVPGTVRTAIYHRVSHLQKSTQEVLHQASVLGQLFAFDDLEAMTGWNEEDLDEAMQEARKAGLVRVMGRGNYRFDHALTQQALYANLSPRRQRALHRAAGQALGRLPERHKIARAPELAWHNVEGEELEQGLAFSLIAAEQAEAVFAHAEAEQSFRVALGLAQDIGDTVREGESLLKLGQLLHTVARYEEALEMLERSTRIFTSNGDFLGVGDATAHIGRVHYSRGTPEHAIEQTQQVLNMLEPLGPSPTLAALYVTLATLFWASGRFSEQLTIADKVGLIARKMGNDTILVEAKFWRGYALLAVDQTVEGVLELEQVSALAEKVGNLTILSRTLNAIGVVYEEMGDFEREKPYLVRALEIAERNGDPSLVAFIRHRCGECAFWAGEWEEARTNMQQAATLDEDIGRSWASPYLLNGLGRIRLVTGDIEEASRHLNNARGNAEHNKDRRALRIVQNSLAERDLLIGQPTSALARINEEELHPEARQGDSFNELWRLVIVAQAHFGLGQDAEADTIIGQVIEQTDTTHEQPIKIEALRVQGMIASRQGRWSDAERSFDQALLGATTMGYVYGAARALHSRGALHIQRDAPGQAQEDLKKALVAFRKLGATPYIAQTEQMLALLDEGDTSGLPASTEFDNFG